jgi:hypothetical protein
VLCRKRREEGGLYSLAEHLRGSRVTNGEVVLLAINGMGEGMATFRKAQRAS